MARDFTTGSISKGLFSLAGPIVAIQLLQSAYQFIDTFWVGRLGEEAVAAVSLSFPVLFLMMSLAGGLSIGAGVLIAQNWGAKKYQQAEHIATQAAIYSIAVAAVFSVIGWFLSPYLMQLLGAEVGVLGPAVEYLQLSFLGMPFLFGYFVYMQVSRGVGEVKAPFYIVLATVILNIILDPLFIYGWGVVPAFGVAGAAAASVATQGLSMLIGYVLLTKGTHGITMRLADVPFHWTAIKQTLKIGVPASLDQASRALGLIIMAGFVALLGTTAVAAYGIGLRVFSFVIIPAVGVMVATSTMIGQNLGAKKPDRAEKAAKLSALWSFIGLTIVGGLVFVFAESIVAFFVPGEQAVISAGGEFLRWMAFTFGLIGVQFSIAGAFRGSGHTVKAGIITVITLYVVQLPVAYLLSQTFSFGTLGIWLAIPIANIVGAVVALIWFSRKTWLVPVEH